MGDWLGLPVVWMSVLILGAVYLYTSAVYLIITKLAVGEHAKAFKAISPGMLPPLSVVFALLVGFSGGPGLERRPAGECRGQPGGERAADHSAAGDHLSGRTGAAAAGPGEPSHSRRGGQGLAGHGRRPREPQVHATQHGRSAPGITRARPSNSGPDDRAAGNGRGDRERTRRAPAANHLKPFVHQLGEVDGAPRAGGAHTDRDRGGASPVRDAWLRHFFASDPDPAGLSAEP